VGPLTITCALTGALHDKSDNPALPEQPDEIVAQAVAACEAGAAILHVHARDAEGHNTSSAEVFAELHERLLAETDAIVQLTTGGAPGLAVEQRLAPIALAPEMASLNMGLLNFFVRGRQLFFPNHRDDIERFAREMAARGIKPEFEVYSPPMLHEVAHVLSLDLFAPPFAVNLVFNTPTQGGQRGNPRDLFEIHGRIAELPVAPGDVHVSVTALDESHLTLTTMAMAMGLDVRTGMEDTVLYGPRRPASGNPELVARTVRIAAELGRRPATPAEARRSLGLAPRGAVEAGAEKLDIDSHSK
jgi:3-keto-5-aminohexanoate cleavage enzyme